MRLLVDTQPIIWAVEDPHQLRPNARPALASGSNQLLISAASIWEIAIKVGIAKLSLSLPYGQWMTKAVTDLGASILPITIEYADVQSKHPMRHRDPFDRLLAAQSVVESLTLVSGDRAFDQYGATRLW